MKIENLTTKELYFIEKMIDSYLPISGGCYGNGFHRFNIYNRCKESISFLCTKEEEFKNIFNIWHGRELKGTVQKNYDCTTRYGCKSKIPCTHIGDVMIDFNQSIITFPVSSVFDETHIQNILDIYKKFYVKSKEDPRGLDSIIKGVNYHYDNRGCRRITVKSALLLRSFLFSRVDEEEFKFLIYLDSSYEIEESGKDFIIFCWWDNQCHQERYKKISLI